MIYIGVDPGKHGGYAWIIDGQATVRPWDDLFFTQDMQCLAAMDEPKVACVEKVGARPGQGTVSMFSFGKSAGYIEGVLRALCIGYQLIPPPTWKREFSLIHAEKRKSIETAKKLFPTVRLMAGDRSRTEHDGMAEALLMAEWARRRMG